MSAFSLFPANAIRVCCIVLLWGCVDVTAAEKPLPKHAIAQIGGYQFYHGPDVRAMISPDGKRIASVGNMRYFNAPEKEKEEYEGKLILWDSATGERVHELEVPSSPAVRPCFSPDGRSVAVGYGQAIVGNVGIAIFDVATGKLQTNIEQRKTELIGFSTDGKSVLFYVDGDSKLIIEWDIQKAEERRRIKRPEIPAKMLKEREDVEKIILSADAKHIAILLDVSPDYEEFRRMNPEAIRIPHHFPCPTAIAMSDGETGKILYRKEFPDGEALRKFVFTADGKQFVTCDKEVTFYDTATGKKQFSLDTKSASSVSLSPNGRWIIVHDGRSGTQLWNLETKKLVHKHFSEVSSLRSEAEFSADGKLVVFVTGTTIRLFETATGKERLPSVHRSAVLPRFTEDGKGLFTTCYELQKSWDVSTLKKTTLQKSQSITRRKWDSSPDSRLLLQDNDDQLSIRDAVTGKVIHDLEKDGWSGSFCEFSYDGTRLAVNRYLRHPIRDGVITWGGEPEAVRLYDTKTGKKTGDIPLKKKAWGRFAFSTEGKMLAWADPTGDIHVHDGMNGKPIRKFHSEEKLCDGDVFGTSLLFSPDGEYIIVESFQSGREKEIKDQEWIILPTRVFQVSTGKEVSRFYTDPEAKDKGLGISCTASSPNGNLLAFAEKDTGTIRLFDLFRGKMLVELKGHRHGVHAMTFSPDGKTLASGGEDGVAYLWDVTEFIPKPKE